MLKRKIRIGYEDVKLDLVDNIPSDNGDHVFGEFDSIKNSIVLDKKQTPRSLANCLLHEVIHAVIYQSGLNSNGNCLSNEKDEELAVNAISNQLSQVIRDNKWFLPYIQKSLFKDVKSIEKSRVKTISRNKKSKRTLRQRCLKLYGWPSAMAEEPFSTVPVAVFPFPVDARALKHAILHQGPAAGVKV
jgi:hypothetical protein